MKQKVLTKLYDMYQFLENGQDLEKRGGHTTLATIEKKWL